MQRYLLSGNICIDHYFPENKKSTHANFATFVNLSDIVSSRTMS